MVCFLRFFFYNKYLLCLFDCLFIYYNQYAQVTLLPFPPPPPHPIHPPHHHIKTTSRLGSQATAQGVATARAEAAAALVCLRHWRRLSRSISLLLLLLLCVVFILFATELTHYNCFSNFKNKIKIRWSAPPTPPPPFFLSNICVCSKGRLFRRLATDAPLVNQCRSHCCNCFQRNC